MTTGAEAVTDADAATTARDGTAADQSSSPCPTPAPHPRPASDSEASAPVPASEATAPHSDPPPPETTPPPSAPDTSPTSWNDGLIARRAKNSTGAKHAAGRRPAPRPEAGAESRDGGRPAWRDWAESQEWDEEDQWLAQDEWMDDDEWRRQRDWQEWEDEGENELEAVLSVLKEPGEPVQEPRGRRDRLPEMQEYGPGPSRKRRSPAERLRPRLDALRELIGLSRTRLDGATLAEAGRVLDAADERYQLSGEHTVVAVAGATGSGKSSLFNALVGADRSDVGARRPTTAEPVACVWSGGWPGAEALLDRLGVSARRRYAPAPGAPALPGLVLLDLPDHDSAVVGHRDQVDRMLELVDAVIWVVDPEKYADAVLHERYLRPLAGHAEVTFVVLNQVDRLPGDAAVQVVDDLRRLLDEDGLALGEHGEPGAAVLALSAATGEGVGELRETLRQFVAERGAADRRLAADVDAAAGRLWPAYVADGRYGLTEPAREEFEDWLAEAVGAGAMGSAAERDWLRHAERACGTPWSRLRLRRRAGARGRGGRPGGGRTSPGRTGASRLWHRDACTEVDAGGEEACATVGGWVPVDGRATARPLVEQAVRTVAGEASEGLPGPWAQAVREAATRGAEGLPEALDRAAAVSEGALRAGPQVRPRWWSVAGVVQGLLALSQVTGVLWLLAVAVGAAEAGEWLSALLVAGIGTAGGPALSWACGVAGRAPARRYGQEAERRLRTAAAVCGRAAVLEPVAAELLRYREVREQYAVAAGL
ncbi:ATP-binding protein [Streptomyces albus subsp. albus]|nr:ATP-binding protein [Streptomyces albus subsp. albus]